MRRASARAALPLTPPEVLRLWADVERWPSFVEGFARQLEVDRDMARAGRPGGLGVHARRARAGDGDGDRADRRPLLDPGVRGRARRHPDAAGAPRDRRLRGRAEPRVRAAAVRPAARRSPMCCSSGARSATRSAAPCSASVSRPRRTRGSPRCAERLGIQQVRGPPTAEDGRDAGGQRAEDLLIPAASQSDGVRRADHTRVAVEAVVHERRLGWMNVERDRREPPRRQSVRERARWPWSWRPRSA